VTYRFDEVKSEDEHHRNLWKKALTGTDIAVCTVHPPRNGFHCSLFAARCIEEAGIDTILMPKTGTIVPEYKREFYLPPREIKSHVISITGFTRRYLIDEYKIPDEDVSLIYQGTEVSRFTPDAGRKAEAIARYKLPEGAGPVLGNVGSFEHRKGQLVLLEAIANIRKMLPSVHLMLVGDGPDREKILAKIEELDLLANVTVFPFTREPMHVFERIDILVLSSLYKEGLPNVILEAFSMELPVVASRMAGVPEVVIDGETGWMVEPGDAEALASVLVRLCANPAACRNMGLAGRRLVEEKMDKVHQFDAFLGKFKSLLEAR
jgi:glycosyltransferase involved in cell wall biosynthesis